MNHQPLAYRMRPRTIDEVIGQEHLVSPGKITLFAGYSKSARQGY